MTESVEYFHNYYREFSQDNAAQIRALFLALVGARMIRARNPSAVHMVMIDDQSVRRKARANFFTPVIAQLCSIGADFVVYEKDLNRAKVPWLQGQSNAATLSKTIKKVYNGNLQCSHYVAIWYLMRLGLVESFDCFIPVSERAMLGEVSPVADKLLNYLPRQYKEVEQATELEILSMHEHWSSIKKSVKRVYYDSPSDL